jgi:hypothetical protein
MKLADVTSASMASAIRCAVERELGTAQGVTPAMWAEIKGHTLEDLLSMNTDALRDDIYEASLKGADLVNTLNQIKAGSELLGVDYAGELLRIVAEFDPDFANDCDCSHGLHKIAPETGCLHASCTCRGYFPLAAPTTSPPRVPAPARPGST